MSKARLDKELLAKLALKTAKSEKYVREQISKRASRMGISSEAAQILWAKEFGIGTAGFHRGLVPHIQEEVRAALPAIFARTTMREKVPVSASESKSRSPVRSMPPVRLAIEYLLKDDELRGRCTDLLRARGNYDRAFREATTVLDDRLKNLSGVKEKLNPAALVGKVLNPNPKLAILKVSDDPDEQEGFFSICKGLVLAFRNPAHHQLSNKFSREDALKFCGFVDTLLAVLQQAQKNAPIP